MERMYRALTRLATAALVSGLVIVIMLTLNSGQLGSYSSDAPGFFDTLRFAIPQYLTAAISFLIDGAVFLGIVVAWADYRRIWTVVLLAIALIALAAPVSLNVFMMGDFFARHPRIAQVIGGRVTLLFYLLSLVPIGMTLVFARLRGGGRATLRAEADATLDITRGPL